MITKYKLFEKTILKKPDIDKDDDYSHDWNKWAIQELNMLFGSYLVGGNADWGGYNIWNLLGDGFVGYYIVESDDFLIFLERKFDENSEENIDTEIFLTNADDNDLEGLIKEVGKVIPQYFNITGDYLITQKTTEYNI